MCLWTPSWRNELNLPYPGKRVEPRAGFLRKSVNGRGEEDRRNDKEEDEASCQGKGCNFRGGTAVAMHRLGQPDHDKLRKTGERIPGHRTPRILHELYLTGALMRERRDG